MYEFIIIQTENTILKLAKWWLTSRAPGKSKHFAPKNSQTSKKNNFIFQPLMFYGIFMLFC